MTYSLEPTRVSRGSKAPLILVVGLAVAVVGFAALGEHPPARAVAAVAASPTPSASPSGANVAVQNGPPASAHPGLGHGDDGLLGPAPAPVGTRWTPPLFDIGLAPQMVRCHGIERGDCLRLANAAADEIVDAGETLGAIRTVDVWPSLLCGDSLVCPPSLLRRVVPLGSAVFAIDGASRDAWVNVGTVRMPPFPSPAQATPPVENASAQLEAWIVR